MTFRKSFTITKDDRVGLMERTFWANLLSAFLHFPRFICFSQFPPEPTYSMLASYEKTLSESCKALHKQQDWKSIQRCAISITKLCKMQNAILGKTTEREMSAQPEFCRKAGGLWGFFSEYKPLLRHLICTIFHHYLSWCPSEYHLRTKFDHSNCQNIHFQSRNCCFKKLTDFRRK